MPMTLRAGWQQGNPPARDGPGIASCEANAASTNARSGVWFDWNQMLRPIALAVLIGLPSAAFGATPPLPESSPVTAEAPPSDSERPADQQAAAADAGDNNVLDTTRGYVRGATEWVVRSVDSWFGEKSFEQGGRVAGRIGLSTLWRQDEGFDWLTRFAVRVHLPNLEDKGGFLFVGRDNEKEVVSDRPDTFTRRETLRQETRDDQSFFAGVGAQIADVFALRAGFRGGLKPYAQARYQKLW
jgi:hypothetical protein